MTRSVIHLMLIISTLASCDTESNKNESKIEIGEYTFDFPNDFKLMKESGIDSYVGKISNSKIDFQYDYGYYSDQLGKSVNEYLADDVWKWNALPIKQNQTDTLDFDKAVAKMRLLKIQKLDSANYILKYSFSDNTSIDIIFYAVKIPDYISNVKQ